jgi:hypothetical protein
MEYQSEAALFLRKSKEELRRLEEQLRRLSEIIARLEVFLLGREENGGTEEGATERVPTLTLLDSSTDLLPDSTPPTGFRAVGEIAEEILKMHGAAMSLDDLYRRMKDRPDLPPSQDLKNAIRASLIRRRPRILSERRGWFRYMMPH